MNNNESVIRLLKMYADACKEVEIAEIKCNAAQSRLDHARNIECTIRQQLEIYIPH